MDAVIKTKADLQAIFSFTSSSFSSVHLLLKFGSNDESPLSSLPFLLSNPNLGPTSIHSSLVHAGLFDVKQQFNFPLRRFSRSRSPQTPQPHRTLGMRWKLPSEESSRYVLQTCTRLLHEAAASCDVCWALIPAAYILHAAVTAYFLL